MGLGRLGIDKDSYQLLTFLPLIQVAWADGRIQKAERTIIVDVAERYGCTKGPAAAILEGWLIKRPSSRFFARARELLMALAHKKRGIGADIRIKDVAELVDLCEDVARAAGGLFGFFPVHVNERRAIAEIMDEIGVPPSALIDVLGDDWKDLDQAD
jgi:hypothetical protein